MEENKIEENNNKIVEVNNNVSQELKDFAGQWKIAVQLAKSDLVPDHFKGKPENVIIGLQLANQIGIAPFTVLQNLSIVRGKASFSGSFCRTLIEKTNLYKDIDLIYVGDKKSDDYGCYLQAIRKSDNKVIKGPVVDIRMVKAEGWSKNPKWNTMTDLMLGYRATAFFCRLNCPGVLSGVMVEGESEDITYNETNNVTGDIL